MALVPIRGRFEDWRSLLHRILEDDTVEGLVIVTYGKEGLKHAYFNITYEQMAYAALLLQKDAMDIPDTV